MKNKKHIWLPAVLVVYTLSMAVIAYPRYQQSGTLNEFFSIVGGCLVIAVVLFLILKRRQKLRDRHP
ncbi:MAG TPA: hypothetical protein DDZ96_15105 [Porphyromonadaceae bacterium]|uniref:LPXTG cell wall anchor domain-containing protein n=1 Tax=Limibacterium fermenti TaxID=3229863 RepID=UPI000E95D29E|nr:hypothetical protein [Porphyromonadaceae bacterium]HBL35119.1 hypothetical protein [Porphyromonadaceae bacterium]HBX19307.1 hypothetical protein [Porphyromonadaceae bacterium]HBX45198.1 hypothetical protein [Porphyromonadaceae bacterium]HCM20418.1 hypothetical protein [Porphyromonadaceae bacterium]